MSSASNPEADIAILTPDKGLVLLPLNSSVVVNISLSVDTSEKFKSVYIGLQPQNALLFQMPSLTKVKNSALLKEGHVATFRAISTEGEGAIVAFKATISRLYPPPYPMFATTIPESIQLKLFRTEPRFKLDMTATIRFKDEKISGWLEDISCNGCCFCSPKLSGEYLNSSVTILLKDSSTDLEYEFTGDVKNQKKINNGESLGIAFEEHSKIVIEYLLQNMILKGSRDF